MKDWIWGALAVYFVINGFVFEVRWLASDCKHRYIDYLLPLTLAHCEVGKAWQ